MARVKKTESAPPLPKHWSEVKHGCCSCRFYSDDYKDKRSPCFPCTEWSHWEDAEPDKPLPLQMLSYRFADNPSTVSDDTEFLSQATNTTKPTAHKMHKTAASAEESTPPPTDSESAPKKRPGRPKKTIAAQEEPVRKPDTPVAEPKKRVERRKKKTDDSHAQAASSDRDQLSIGL